ncbi:signal peptidase II [Butyricicoccus faecihominis]|uniref:signal peptidase II n=1 Tax=Butyricicoccus faecihominis TaxID=1712515 RepID=UPI00247A084A|nr:signal peptidase II [Butyricicoccus faecihominis]MCQ5128343.1 signal peptidase II [Butyricicoccus faecihominis]
MPFFIIAAVLMIAADQAVKYWALTVLQPQGTIPVIENVFHLTYVENRGAAFSLFAKFDSPWLFVVLATVITIVIIYVLHKGVIQSNLGRWSLVLVAAGALGNAIDRAVRGFVVDLFDFRLIHFPVFNVADIFICLGGLLFVIYVLFQHKDKEPAVTQETEDHE